MPLGKLSKGLVGSINPRFTDYSLPRVTAVLVGLSMLGGFVGILTANLRCTYTTSITPHNDLNHGSCGTCKRFSSTTCTMSRRWRASSALWTCVSRMATLRSQLQTRGLDSRSYSTGDGQHVEMLERCPARALGCGGNPQLAHAAGPLCVPLARLLSALLTDSACGVCRQELHPATR
jgi:hypothetical protein